MDGGDRGADGGVCSWPVYRPWLSGVVSDTSYGVAGGPPLSGGILAGAALIALLQREPYDKP